MAIHRSSKLLTFFGVFCVFSLFFCVQSQAQKIRLVAGNISSGNAQSYDAGHGARIFQGLKPDVVMIQEFNYGTNSAADIRTFVDNTFGKEFVYNRGAAAQIPNGVISRYPFVSSGEWTDPQVANRNFVWARINIPGTKKLWVISVHMLTTDSKRPPEATALVNFIKANVPATDYLVIGGDFNASSRTESQFSIFSEVVRTAGPYPADHSGDENTNANRNKPYDNVLTNQALYSLQVPVAIGGSTFANGLVADTRVYTPISEINPALATDSAATNMQHMAIVKDFQLPALVPPVISTTSPLPGGTIGAAYSQTFAATGGTAPYIWTLASGSLPGGLTISQAGALGGTPTAAGTFTFTVQVADSVSSVATKSVTVTIAPALSISTTSPVPGGTVGTAYSQALAGSGGTAPFAWGLSAGSLPAGVSLSNAGVISGTPTASGNFSFTARMIDSAGATTTKPFTLLVTPALAISTASPLAAGTVGKAYSQSIAAGGGTSPYTWAIQSGTLPGGLSFASPPQISGIPTAAGSFTFVVKVTDSLNASATQSYSITVKEPLTEFLEANGLPAQSAAVDSDNDGFSNLAEFLLGGNPKQASTSIAPALAADQGSGFTYSFSALTAAGSVTWKVQTSPDLSIWTNVDAAAITSTPGPSTTQVSAKISAGSEKRFVRLQISGP